MHHYSPDVLCETILLALEGKARAADLDGSLSDNRLQSIYDTLDQLRATGILDDTAPMPAALLQPRRDSTDPAPLLAAAVVQDTITGLDRVLASANRYEPGPGERPRQAGLPVLSASGHPSSLARLTDPANPLGNTAAQRGARRRRTRAAQGAVHTVRRTWRIALAEAEQTMNTLPISLNAA